MSADPLFTPDTVIAEAARIILANELATIQAHHAELLVADVVAVHETRKAIRRTFTAVKLFRPYFESGVLEGYRRPLRKIMRRLAPCRDEAVFLLKLGNYESAHGSLPGLRQYWTAQNAEADEVLTGYLRKPKRQQFWEEYARFTERVGQRVQPASQQIGPEKVRHLAPLLIYQRLAAVRAFDDHLQDPPLDRMHQLRIRFKDLRYALGFFVPVLGPEIEEARAHLKTMQNLLGDLNDARVALRMLADTPGLETAVSTYRVAKENEIKGLLAEFPRVWATFDSPSWRKLLGKAMLVL